MASEQNDPGGIFLGLNTYDEIQQAPLSIKAQIASNYLNKRSISSFDLCEFSSNNQTEFDIVFRISITAHAMLLSEQLKLDIPNDFWDNITIDKIQSKDTFLSVRDLCVNFFKIKAKPGQFCQCIACGIMGETEDHNLVDFLDRFSMFLSFATRNPEARNTLWFPSIHYFVFSAFFEQECHLNPYLLLGFSFGIPAFIKHHHEVYDAQINSLKSKWQNNITSSSKASPWWKFW